MKKKKKDFDCVEMKHEIQAKILEEMKKYPSEEAYWEARNKEIMSDPHWAKFFKELQ